MDLALMAIKQDQGMHGLDFLPFLWMHGNNLYHIFCVIILASITYVHVPDGPWFPFFTVLIFLSKTVNHELFFKFEKLKHKNSRVKMKYYAKSLLA